MTHDREADAASITNLRVASEATPLLGNQDVPVGSSVPSATAEPESGGRKDVDDDDRPLDLRQLIPLCLARAVEPIAFFSIFPFVNQMVKDNGSLEYGEVGFYSGLIESLFSLTQMCVMILWGRASDRYGRKPVLVISLLGVAVTMGAFGLSRSIWQMILLRCCAGSFAGTVVTLRTMFYEISTPKTQAQAFSWFAFMSNIGIFVGPLMGGALAEPARQYPNVFGNLWLFKEYPYFLPTLGTGVIATTAATIVIVFVDETLPKKSVDETEDTKPEPPTVKSLLVTKGVPAVLTIYGYTMLLAFSYTAILPVYYFTPVQLGGYGFSAAQISLFMALGGAAQALWLLLFFSPLHKRFGTGWMLRACAIAWPIFFLVYPLLNFVLRIDTSEARIAFWVLAPINTAVGVGVSMSFTAAQLALNDICPSREVLATLNALALTINSGLRAFDPAAVSSLFALGVENRILWGQLIWAVLILLAIIGVFVSRTLPKEADSKPLPETRDTQERD